MPVTCLGYPLQHSGHVWYYGKGQRVYCLNRAEEFPTDFNISQ